MLFDVLSVVGYFFQCGEEDDEDPTRETLMYAGSNGISNVTKIADDKPKFQTLPPFSGNPEDWFEWKFKTKNMVVGAGFAHILEDQVFVS